MLFSVAAANGIVFFSFRDSHLLYFQRLRSFKCNHFTIILKVIFIIIFLLTVFESLALTVPKNSSNNLLWLKDGFGAKGIFLNKNVILGGAAKAKWIRLRLPA